MTKEIITAILIMFSFSLKTVAQHTVSVSKSNPIYLDLTSPNMSGAIQKTTIDNSQWLNYTTYVHPSDPTLSIMVEVISGTIPPGLMLTVEASPYVGFSQGKQGSPAGKVTLSPRPKVLINNISTCYTGSGRNEGHQLTFSIIVIDWAKVRSGTNNISIRYTITQ